MESYNLSPTNLTKSFQSPAAFAALGILSAFFLLEFFAYFPFLVHRQKPELINLDEINSVILRLFLNLFLFRFLHIQIKMEPAAALANIFKIAESGLGIPQILDPVDVLELSGGVDECRYALKIVSLLIIVRWYNVYFFLVL